MRQIAIAFTALALLALPAAAKCDDYGNCRAKKNDSEVITIEGAVKKPGLYPVIGQTTLLQALKESGGFNKTADRRNVVVFQTIGGQRSALKST